MKVVDKRNEKKETTFYDLSVGQAYLDSSGRLSIKTSFNSDDNCITFNDEKWYTATEEPTEVITPIEATLTIE